MSSSLFLSAELWKDYEPSEQQIQLTVVDVQSNYLDYYLVNLNKTWVRAMEVQKDLGQIVDYGVYTSDGASSPNVWLTITYADMASMAPSKEKEDAVNAEMKKRYGDNDEEMEKISRGYEEIRKMVDNQRINQVIFK
jgi:hypothetical protein